MKFLLLLVWSTADFTSQTEGITDIALKHLILLSLL